MLSTRSPAPTMKMKTPAENALFSHIWRSLSKLRSLLLELCSASRVLYASDLRRSRKKMSKYRQKILFGSFRLHYNWCSSERLLPANYTCIHHHTRLVKPAIHHHHGDGDGDDDPSTQLSSYLEWLEHKNNDDEMNEIDKLADMFIANCHEKFRLEKIESYRRYQEMLARSI